MTLANQQSALLSTLFSQLPPHSDTQANMQGLSIYQYSLLANAVRALTITFATVASFIPEVTFSALVKEYLKKELKEQYDWGTWGASFPAFINSNVDSNASLLAEIAALDLACHQCERAKNQPRDLASLALLSSHDAYQLSLTFSAGARCLKSAFPLDEIITEIKMQSAAQSHTGQSNATQNHFSLTDISTILTKASQRHEHSIREEDTDNFYYYVIWRPQFQAQYAQISQAEYQWLNLWLTHHSSSPLSIGQALDEVSASSFSIVDWLPKNIEQQLLSAVQLHSLPTDEPR